MSDRARQFLPFDALTGFRKEIKKREKIVVKKIELADDYSEVLNQKLLLVKKGMMITIIYYSNEEYIEKTGIVSDIDPIYKTITIVKDKINIADIIDINSVEFENLEF